MILALFSGGHSAVSLQLQPTAEELANTVSGQSIFANPDFIKPSRIASRGFEGLVIVTAMGFTSAMYWTCRNISQLELDLRCVICSAPSLVLLSHSFSLFLFMLSSILLTSLHYLLCSSVERIDQYLELPQEPAAIIDSRRPPAYWPSASTSTLRSSNNPLISVERLVVKYASDLPPVLHGVTFTINSGERVAIVGRTGSGKQGLVHTLSLRAS
jgi:ABC-type multidrug transport system fused ATPase/permease subunit